MTEVTPQKNVDRFTRSLNKESSRFYDNFTDRVTGMGPLGNVLPVSTDALCNVIRTGAGNMLYCQNINAQTLLAPTHVATGLSIAGDLTNGDGFDICLQEPGQTDARFNFTIDSEEVGFFVEAKFTVSDVSGIGELLLGFRKTATYQATRAGYTDYAVLGLIAGDLKHATNLNNAGETLTDTTNNVADGDTIVIRVEVTKDGKVKYLTNQKTDGTYDTTGALYSPIVVKDFTFDTGDTVVPCIRFIQASDVCDTLVMQYLSCGYLN